MSHEITIKANGVAEMAFVGLRSAIWHGLGQQLADDASMDVWSKAAGLDWEVFESAVSFQSATGSHIFPDKKALFRSDTEFPLSVVSNDFKVVQPAEVLGFFNDLVSKHGMKLNTAGTLFGGRRFWALADTGKSANIVDGDTVRGFLLLTTAVDGTLATTAKFVSNRVVCNNTLSIALNENSRAVVKKTHKSVFDSAAVKIDLGLIDKGWDDFISNLRKLATTKVDNTKAAKFFQDMFFVKGVAAQDQPWGVNRSITEAQELFRSGTGSNFSADTSWGLLNAITEKYTHGSGKRNPSHQFWDSFYGNNDKMKVKAYDSLVAA